MEKLQLLQILNILMCVASIALFIKCSPKNTLNEVKAEEIIAITNKIDMHNKEVLTIINNNNSQIFSNPFENIVFLLFILVLLLILLNYLI